MIDFKTKHILLISFAFISFTTFSQDKPNEKKGGTKDTTITKDISGKDKTCSSDDPKRPLTKKDLSDLTKTVETLTINFNTLKSAVDSLPEVINSQYTRLKELETLYQASVNKNTNLTNDLTSKNNQLKEEKDKTKQSQDANNLSLSAAKENEKAYNNMVNDFMMSCKNPSISTIDLMKKQIDKSSEFKSTSDKLIKFKEDASALQKASELLRKNNITKGEFSEAKKIIGKLSESSEFLGLKESAIVIKIDYDHFTDLAIKLGDVITKQANIKGDYRTRSIPLAFKDYIYALKPYPFLEKKYSEAITTHECILDLPLK